MGLIVLSADMRATIVDSLRDAEEGHEAAFYASGNMSAKRWAETFALLADKVESGIDIADSEDIKAIGEALELSEENCRELNIPDAADDYERARIYIESL